MTEISSKMTASQETIRRIAKTISIVPCDNCKIQAGYSDCPYPDQRKRCWFAYTAEAEAVYHEFVEPLEKRLKETSK